MEVGSIDSTVNKSGSIPNDSLGNESEPITKSVSDFNVSKDYELISNDVNSVESNLIEAETSPPNGENESLDRIFPEPEEPPEPVPNTSAETHLESNLNVIENQNNENLERDSERMDRGEELQSEEDRNQSEQPEAPHSSIEEGSKPNSETQENPEENPNNNTKELDADFEQMIGPESELDNELLSKTKKKSNISEEQEKLYNNLPESSSESQEPENPSDIREPIDGKEVREDVIEQGDDCSKIGEIDETMCDSTEETKKEGKQLSLFNVEASDLQEKEPVDVELSAESSSVEVEDNSETSKECEVSACLQEDTTKLSELPTEASEKLQTEELLEKSIEDNSPSEISKVTGSNIVSDNEKVKISRLEEGSILTEVEDSALKKVDDSSSSKEVEDSSTLKEVESISSLKEVEDSGLKEVENSSSLKEVEDSGTSKNIPDNTIREGGTMVEKEIGASEIKDTSDEVPTEEKSGETLSKDNSVATQKKRTESDVTNSKNIEFAQVNFDSNEQDHEKEGEDQEKEGSSSKDVELDPIASESDVLDSMENTQGADEEITIIPDSEREITEAEKEAASSLPPLKDISDKASTTEPASQETDSAENKIKMYKYEKDDLQNCAECKEKKIPMYHFSNNDKNILYMCDDTCLALFKEHSSKKITIVTDEGGGLRVKNFMETAVKEPLSLAFIRKCASCKKVTDDIETNLTWEIMDFCNEFCLSKYQKMIGSKCASCTGEVKSTSLGKYCVRFGNDIRQFCTSTCLEHYKKGLKVCSYCQQDMSNRPDGFLAPVGEKGQFKDFCSKVCMEKYDIMTNDRPPSVAPGTICSVCKTEKPITIEFEHSGAPNYFCGEPCFVAFAFVNKITPGKCAMCRRHFNKIVLEQHTMYYDNVQYSFCSNSCENIYIIAHRKIVPCSWCKVKKYNFDMIKKYSKNAPVINMCSINCLSLYQVSVNAVSAKPLTCHYCQKNTHPAYHLTMSDATIRNFCSYSCVMSFQNQFPKQPITITNLSELPVPAGMPQKNKKGSTSIEKATPIVDIPQLPIISNVQSLASTNGSPTLPPGLTPIPSARLTRSKASPAAPVAQPPPPIQTFTELPVQVQLKQHYIVKQKPCPEQRNVAIMCNPRKAVKSIQSTPTMVDASMQTEREEIKKILIPVPVPIYVPTPCHMFSAPVPIPVPFPLPIPVPIFIPTTRNSSAGIMKEIKKIQVKIPTDPYEAELLMMAEMVAGEKKEENTDSESDLEDTAADGGDYSPEPVDASNTFGDDMLQMALKMATELDEPAVDLEGALTANTITAPQGAHPDGTEENVDDPQPIHQHNMMERSPLRGRKRGMRGTSRGQSKRGRRMSHQQAEMPMMQQVQQAPPPPEPQEKPDANMCLKYTFGVNAWKQWVTTKNTELEKSSRRVKLFKTEILQLTADELNYSLCLFVKEVRKPNGQEYAPDTIYYLCLGIQQYLFENGRIDNIFCDPYYEKFTDCLDEVAKKFSVLYNDSHYIVTRVEEEHLWESKQLGAHSPHVLLSTLMFFNTKHFNLTCVDEHMQLSFSHIMKHWKRNPNQPGAAKIPGSRNVLLRFYPPQSAIQNNQRKKKVYEQQENEENPLRCPVKLYEFYLSKCPESVKTRNDVFYLQPERSCVPDSPVWYSTMPLPKEALEKMLHRVKMVKEINVALLTS